MLYNLNNVQCFPWLCIVRDTEWSSNAKRNYKLWWGEAYSPNRSENEIWMVGIIGNQESSARELVITWLYPCGFSQKVEMHKKQYQPE